MGAYGSPDLSPNNHNYSDKNMHSFVTCKKCGFTYSDYYSCCPKCNNGQFNEFYNYKQKRKNTVLSVFALIFSFLFFPVGLILGIVDIIKNKYNRHVYSVLSIFIALVFLLLLFVKNNTNFSNSLINSARSNQTINSIQLPNNNPINTEIKSEYNRASDAYGINTVFVASYINKGTKENTPQEGYLFFICEFDIGNNTESNLQINSVQNFTAYADEYLCNNIHLTFDSENPHNYIDCNIAPGKRNKGVVVFEIPTQYQKLEIRYKPFINSQAEFIYTFTHNN